MEMPYFKNLGAYQQSASSVFERNFPPGAAIQLSGIYRCCACGYEVTLLIRDTLPNERRCGEHALKWRGALGQVQWRLVATPIDTNG